LWKTFGTPDDEIVADIEGRQGSDGTYSRQIAVYAGSDKAELSSEQARRFAALLLQAADDVDGWAAR
jgi:hypothetical protein